MRITLNSRFNRRAVLGGLGAIGSSLCLARSTSGAAERDPVQQLLDGYVAQGRLAGAVAAIGTQQGTRFVSSGRIALDPQAAPVDPDSLWRVYSMTKLVTGAAAMLLVERGRLELETPVAEFFPSFARSEVLDELPARPPHPAKSRVTVRHLMTHSSGLVGSLVPEPPLSTFYLDRRLNVSRVSIQDDSGARHQSSLLAFASAAGTVPLAFEPGTRWSYGISSDVLGGVIEKVSGMPFEMFLDSNIFQPLGMRDTAFTVAGSQLRRFTTNYQVSDGELSPIDSPPRSIFAMAPPFPYPGSGLVSSARDFTRFAAMLLGEGAVGSTRLMASRTARTMMSNLLPADVTATGEGWGAGGMVLLASTATAGPLGKNRGTYGWEGAAGTSCWVDRAAGVFAVLMTQYMPNRAYTLHEEFAALALAGASGG
jgi:CubicO group peptidase (beta-lactamase class C family)